MAAMHVRAFVLVALCMHTYMGVPQRLLGRARFLYSAQIPIDYVQPHHSTISEA